MNFDAFVAVLVIAALTLMGVATIRIASREGHTFMVFIGFAAMAIAAHVLGLFAGWWG